MRSHQGGSVVRIVHCLRGSGVSCRCEIPPAFLSRGLKLACLNPNPKVRSRRYQPLSLNAHFVPTYLAVPIPAEQRTMRNPCLHPDFLKRVEVRLNEMCQGFFPFFLCNNSSKIAGIVVSGVIVHTRLVEVFIKVRIGRRGRGRKWY